MRYAAAYRVPVHDKMGYCDRSSYITVNSAGYYEFDEPCGVTHRVNGRKDYYISYNHGNPMKLRLAKKEYLIGAGTVFIYRPFEEQYYGQASRDLPIANYWAHFTGYGAAELLTCAKLAGGNIFTVGVSEEIPPLFDRLIDEITGKKTGFELLSASLLMQLVALIGRKINILPSGKQNIQHQRIYETEGYIHRNYAKKITIPELAAMTDLSTGRYSSLFRQITGVSPQQYLINFRLEKARELMRHTNLNIRQIATLTGFEDQFYFSRLFKKYEHMSPSDYMRMIDK